MTGFEVLRDVVHPSLAEVIGKAAAHLIMERAYAAWDESGEVGSEEERFRKVVHFILRNPRLEATLGPMRLGQLESQWLGALR